MWGSTEKSGTVFFESCTHPLNYQPPKIGSPPKNEQNSEIFEKKLLIDFLFLKKLMYAGKH